MKQDCTIFHATANETNNSHATEDHNFQKGTHVSEPDDMTGPVVEKCTQSKASKTESHAYEPVSWSYLFVHHKKVPTFEEHLKKDAFTYFVHKTIKYMPRHKNKGGMKQVEKPTVSGLIFIQGDAEQIQEYLDNNIPHHKLCKNCSTGEVATIPCNQMEPFMRVAEAEPDRLRFLLRPFIYYSKNRTLLRIITGNYAGLEGYVIRIARDRKLVIDVGGMAIAIAGIHAERFEEVHKNEGNTQQERATFYKRNLHERNAFIDRYFHPVKTTQEVAAQVENINILRLQTLKDVAEKKLDLKDAFDTFYFMIEEIGYYYVPFINYFKNDLQPIFAAGRLVLTELEKTVSKFKQSPFQELSQHCETELEELTAQYGYLYE